MPARAAPSPPSTDARRRHAALALLLLVMAVLAAEAWYPFRPQLPVWWRTTGVRPTDGVLHLDGHSLLETPGPPTWLTRVRDTSDFHLDLQARTDQVYQEGPARILTISRDVYGADLMVGQDGDDLVVRLRRPGGDGSGENPYTVIDLLDDHAWHHVQLDVAGGDVRLTVDGEVWVDEQLGPDPLSGWDTGYRLGLGDEHNGERGWQGDLREAEIRVDGTTTDLLAGGVLVPATGMVVRSRARHLLHLSNADPLWLVTARLVAFIPAGAALVWLTGRRRWAALGVVVLAAALTVSKLFVAERHPVLSDALTSMLGGFVGVALAGLRARRSPAFGHRAGSGHSDDDATEQAPTTVDA